MYQVNGELIKQRREQLGWSQEELAEKSRYSLEIIQAVEELRIFNEGGPNPNNISTTKIYFIVISLGLDYFSFINGELRKWQTIRERLNYFDPDGLGSNEQRIFRLMSHQVISRSLGAELLETVSEDLDSVNIPENNLGCKCLACREFRVGS